MNESERPALSYREYKALRQLFGIIDGWHFCGSELDRRLALIPGGRETKEEISRLSDRLLEQLCGTIPYKKLAVIKKELDSTRCEINVMNTVSEAERRMYTYCETKALERITEAAMATYCELCDKRGGEARACPMRKDLERMFLWDYPKVKDGQVCHFAQHNIESEDIDEILQRDISGQYPDRDDP